MAKFMEKIQGLLSQVGLSSGMAPIGPGDDEPIAPLTPKQMQDWNRYVDYLELKGYKGSKDLDKKETGLAKKLLEDFRKEYPDASITYDDVKKVQIEMQKLKDQAQGFAARRNDPNATKIMAGVSQVDGWPGAKTTSFKFPEMAERQLHNNSLVGQRNLGLVSGSFQPTGAAVQKKPLPKGVKLEPLYDAAGNKTGMGYTDPATGDVITYNQ